MCVEISHVVDNGIIFLKRFQRNFCIYSVYKWYLQMKYLTVVAIHFGCTVPAEYHIPKRCQTVHHFASQRFDKQRANVLVTLLMGLIRHVLELESIACKFIHIFVGSPDLSDIHYRAAHVARVHVFCVQKLIEDNVAQILILQYRVFVRSDTSWPSMLFHVQVILSVAKYLDCVRENLDQVSRSAPICKYGGI